MSTSFKAIRLGKTDAGQAGAIETLTDADLTEGDVDVRVDYSALNYKDALALTGQAPVVRKWPITPGIDLAGVVERSNHKGFAPGDRVLLNGWGAGETHDGGFAQKPRLQGDWLVETPAALSSAQAMAIGTAGYTAMLCVMALEAQGVTPEKGEILVTGASGSVAAWRSCCWPGSAIASSPRPAGWTRPTISPASAPPR